MSCRRAPIEQRGHSLLTQPRLAFATPSVLPLAESDGKFGFWDKQHSVRLKKYTERTGTSKGPRPMKTKLIANLYRYAGAFTLALGTVTIVGRNGRLW